MNFDFLAALFFPRVCIPCRKSLHQGVLCADCRAGIAITRTLHCAECGARIRNAAASCHPRFPYILGAAGSYGNEALKNLIHSLKFQGVRAAAEPLASIMAEYFSALEVPERGTFVVVPVPLSRERRRARGFNQSELIARRFADSARLPLEAEALIRIKHAKPQSETKSSAERRENIRGVFAIANLAAVAGKNIVVIDDVVTSGATSLEAARTLKSAGAARIIALAAARA